MNEERRKKKWSPRKLAVFTALATFLTYLVALRNGFVIWDDDAYILRNVHIRSLDLDMVRWAFTDIAQSYWHPLAWLSHALDYALWGMNPVGHHLTSIALHSINAALVMLLVVMLLRAAEDRRTGSGQAAPLLLPREISAVALIAGLLFGLHPLHVESVAWVSERKDLLCAFFYLLSIGAYARSASAEASADTAVRFRLTMPVFLSLCLFVLAVLSKPMAVTLPVVLMLLDWYPFGRIRSLRDVARSGMQKIPFFLVACAVSIMAIAAQQRNDSLVPLLDASWGERIFVAAQALVWYGWKMVLPLNLLPFYPVPHAVSLLSVRYGVSMVLVLLLTAWCVRAVGREKAWMAVWSFYVITLLPVLGFVRVGTVVFADRFTYLPSIGPFLLAGLGAVWLWRRFERQAAHRALAGAGIALGLVMCVLTVHQISLWKDSIRLWSAVIEKEPRKVSMAYNNRGVAYRDRGDLESALADFTEAIALDPASFGAYANRGIVLADKGRTEEAMDDLSRAIALNARYADAYVGRGVVYLKRGQPDRALRDLTTAVRLDPFLASAYTNRGVAYKALGSPARAMADFDAAISADPGYADAYTYRGILNKESGRYDKAVADYTQAIKLKPSSAEAYNNRGTVFRRTGRLDQAIEDYTKAIALAPSSDIAYTNRGIALRERGDLQAALKDYTRAIELNPEMRKAYSDRAAVNLRLGRNDLAMRDYQRACELGSGEACAALRALPQRR